MFTISIKETIHTANGKPITSGIHPFHATKNSNGKLEGIQHWYLSFTLEMRGCSESNNVLTNEYATVRRMLNEKTNIMHIGQSTNLDSRCYFTFECKRGEDHYFYFNEMVNGQWITEEIALSKVRQKVANVIRRDFWNEEFVQFKQYSRAFDGRGIPKAS
jgi:hypothetical protein